MQSMMSSSRGERAVTELMMSSRRASGPSLTQPMIGSRRASRAGRLAPPRPSAAPLWCLR